MTKISKNSEKSLKVDSVEKSSRRDFFKKTAIYSASALTAATVLAPIKLNLVIELIKIYMVSLHLMNTII